MTETKNDTFLEKVVRDISENHHKIIDDWCKAYLAHLYKEGMEIKPNCFTLFHKMPSGLTGDVKHEYWFEPRDKQETANEKLLKLVMGQLAKLIDYVENKIEEVKENPDRMDEEFILNDIRNFLNFVDNSEE